jgi:hypothetical protein
MGSVEWRSVFSGEPGLAMRIGGLGAGGGVGAVGGLGGRCVVVSVADWSGILGGDAARIGRKADEDVSSRASSG